MAAAATTFSESTPAARAAGFIGMRTVPSASSSQRPDRPSPSVPSSSATRPASRNAAVIGVARSSGGSASVRNPADFSAARPSYQPLIRAYGMANTAPIETLTELRYSGSAQLGDSSTASTPSAA